MNDRLIRRLLHPAFPLAAVALLALPAQANAQEAVWSATLTVGGSGGSEALGYCRGAANCASASGHYGALGEPGFSIGGTNYAVTSIRWGVGGEGFVHFTLDQPLPAEDLATLVLHLDDASLRLADARVNEPAEFDFTANYHWDGYGSAPEDGASVSVSLTRDPQPLRQNQPPH